MKTSKSEEWIMIPNSVFKNDTNTNYLTTDELYLFALLYRWRVIYDNLAVYSIDGLNELCEYKFMSIKPNGDASRNKNKIRQLINSLIEKEYLYLESDDLESKKNNELLYMGFFETKHYHKIIKGHNQNITYRLFDTFKCPIRFYIYAYIDCFGKEGRTFSYAQIAENMGISHDKAESIIKEMNTYKFKPRIWKFSGDYYQTVEGEVRQQENTYFTRPSEDTIKKWNGFYGDEGYSKEKGVGLKKKDNPF